MLLSCFEYLRWLFFREMSVNVVKMETVEHQRKIKKLLKVLEPLPDPIERCR